MTRIVDPLSSVIFGHTTFDISTLTSLKYLIDRSVHVAIASSAYFRIMIFWQARRDSNPQQPVLETGALPIELLAYLFNMQAPGFKASSTAFLVLRMRFTVFTIFFILNPFRVFSFILVSSVSLSFTILTNKIN